MGIQELTIKGFRSLRDVRWTPGRLNVLIGPNGSGKSNLLDACALLRESALGTLPQGIISRGGMPVLLWDGRETSMNFDLSLEQKTRPPFVYKLEIMQLGRTSNYSVESEYLDDGEKLHIQRLAGSNAVFDPNLGHVTYGDPVPETQTLLSLMAGPFGNPAARAVQSSLESWDIYYDLRVGPESPIRQPAVTRFERKIAPNGQNLVPVLHTLYTGNREFKRSVDAAMTAAFGRDYEGITFPPAADQRIQFCVNWHSLSVPQSTAILSDGILRFLLLIAILANPEPGDLIAIDEPETGLHPSMLPIIAELAADAAERTQVVFTTHSPQFLDAFTEAPTTTVAEWVDGETRLSVLPEEELQRWLKEFSLGSLYRSGELEAMA
jgi:predicted ATPase